MAYVIPPAAVSIRVRLIRADVLQDVVIVAGCRSGGNVSALCVKFVLLEPLSSSHAHQVRPREWL